MTFHWNILSTNLKHCCLLAHEFSLEHCLNKLEILLSYKDETNLRHFARIALKKNCCHKKMTQTCSIFPKLQWRNSEVLAHEFSLGHSFNKLETLFSFSPWIFNGAFFQQTWNIVVLQRWDKFATFCQNCIKEKFLPYKDDTNLQHFFLNCSEEIQRC